MASVDQHPNWQEYEEVSLKALEENPVHKRDSLTKKKEEADNNLKSKTLIDIGWNHWKSSDF